MRKVIAAALAWLALALIPDAGRAQTKTLSFQESEGQFSGTVQQRVIADLNGDQRRDLLLSFTRRDREKQTFVAVFYQKPEGGFGPAPDFEYSFPPEARVFAVGEVAPPAGEELVVVTGQGVFWAEKNATGFGRLQPLVLSENLFTGSESEQVMFHRILWDLDGDRRPEIVLPSEKGPLIFRREAEGKFVLFQQVNLAPLISYRIGSFGDVFITDDINQFLRWHTYAKRVIASHTMPDLFFVDANADGRIDLLALLNNKLRVYCQEPEGRFPDRPTLEVERSILTPEEKKLTLTGEALTFSDLNQDGIIDLIMTKWGSTENRTEMSRFLYFGRPGLAFNRKPDQIIGSTSAGVEFGVLDLNQDHRLDLVIPYFHFAPAQAFKIMTQNSIKIQFQLYLCGANGRYTQDAGKEYARPDRRVILDYKIDIIGILLDFQTLIQGKFQPLITFRDFNGDGFPDLAADTGADKLAFYLGNAKVEYAKQPDQLIPLESAVVYDLADLNGDGKTDIITYYESKERVQEKRKLAQKARQQAQQPGAGETPPALDESRLLATAEATRVKVLWSQ